MFGDTYDGSGHHCTVCGKHFCRCPLGVGNNQLDEEQQTIERNRKLVEEYERMRLEQRMEAAFKKAASERHTWKYRLAKFVWSVKRLFSLRSSS